MFTKNDEKPGNHGEVWIQQTSSKFSLRIWLDKQTLSDHRNSVKLQTLSLSHGKPHPAAMQPWRRVEPTQANTIELIIHRRNGNFDAVWSGCPLLGLVAATVLLGHVIPNGTYFFDHGRAEEAAVQDTKY